MTSTRPFGNARATGSPAARLGPERHRDVAAMESASATYRRKVTESLSHWGTLVDAILDEDRLLRARLTTCPRDLRETRGPGGSLSFKEILGHIAFWDSFTVEFFHTKLDVRSFNPTPPVNFEERSRQALQDVADLPFGEVLARYLESTGALVDFIKEHWSALSPREKNDFWVPLKHRRHHRIALFTDLDEVQRQRGDGENELAAGA
jgi:hypothetical protein